MPKAEFAGRKFEWSEKKISRQKELFVYWFSEKVRAKEAYIVDTTERDYHGDFHALWLIEGDPVIITLECDMENGSEKLDKVYVSERHGRELRRRGVRFRKNRSDMPYPVESLRRVPWIQDAWPDNDGGADFQRTNHPEF